MKVEKLIYKYESRINTLKENMKSDNQSDPNYPYQIDIDLNKEIVKDLKRLKKVGE